MRFRTYCPKAELLFCNERCCVPAWKIIGGLVGTWEIMSGSEMLVSMCIELLLYNLATKNKLAYAKLMASMTMLIFDSKASLSQ